MYVLDTRDVLSSLKSIRIHGNYFLMCCLVMIYIIYINYYESIYYCENNRIALI